MICIFCMRDIGSGARFCPFCGKDLTVPIPQHHLPPGTLLHQRYWVGAALGEGGFGITYAGLDTSLNLRVAIKEFFPSGFVTRLGTASPNVTEISDSEKTAFFKKGRMSFMREARALAQFAGSRGIVDVRDFFEENNTAYIVMEYLDGVTLKQYLKEHGRLTPGETLELLSPVMESLVQLHRSNLIHRDISPDNIMITDNGVKLLDFGAARNIGGDQKSLSVMLKPGYAPEEQYRSKGVQGPWTDVYALCATIYHCITGVRPDESPDRMHNDSLQPPSMLGVCIDRSFEYTLLRGLAVQAEYRIQSVEALMNDLMRSGDRTEYYTPDPVSAVTELYTDNTDNRIIREEMPPPQGSPKKPISQKVIICILSLVTVCLGVMLLLILNRDSLQTSDNTVRNSAIADAGTEENTAAAASQTAEAGSDSLAVTEDAAPSEDLPISQKGLYVVSDNTPAHAGVVVRSSASSSAEKLATLAEGTVVYYDGGTTKNGYAPIRWQSGSDASNVSSGWVMYRFLVYYADGSLPEPTGSAYPNDAGTAYIGYNTPDHFGVRMRSEPSYYSDDLGVLPEGTPVTVLGNVSGEYTLISCAYGTGWILSQYIEY